MSHVIVTSHLASLNSKNFVKNFEGLRLHSHEFDFGYGLNELKVTVGPRSGYALY